MVANELNHPVEQTLKSYSLGALDDTETSAVEQHITECERCRRIVEEAPPDSLMGLLRTSLSRPAYDATAAELTPEPGSTASTLDSNPPLYKRVAQLLGDGLGAANAKPQAAITPPPGLVDHARYQILDHLGSGGMGTVFKAQHRLMNRSVAIKVINPALLNKPSVKERFMREVKAAANLAHGHIVTAYDAEQSGDLHLLVMEFVHGETLADRIRREGALPVTAACQCIREAALGLQHAHEKGMVHRDIKPANIMIEQGGRTKLMDFGLACFHSENNSIEGITELGAIMGTPDYMAPEQALDPHTADIRADIYSLGCTLYHALAGQVPYPATTPLAKIDAHRAGRPTPLKSIRPDVPAELSAIVERMMAKDAAKRLQTPAEVAEALAPYVQPATQPQPASRRRLPLIAAAVVLMLAPLAYFFGPTVFRFVTNQGVLVIETRDSDIKITVLQDGNEVRILDAKTGTELVLPAAKYKLALQAKSGTRMDRDEITLSRGGKEVVRVTWEKDVRLDTSPDDNKQALDSLQGDWTLVSREVKGEKSDETAKNYKLTIKGDQWILSPGPTATIKIDASKNPRWFDVGKYSPGIYKLEGDILTICRPGGAKATEKATERPTEFKSTKDDGNVVIVYKRLRPPVTETVESLRETLRKIMETATPSNMHLAVETAGKLIALRPNDIEGYYSRGVALLSQGKRAEAIPDLNKVLAIDANHRDALMQRGFAYLNTDQFDLAIADCDRLLKLEPSGHHAAVAYANRGGAWALKGRFDKASADFNAAAILNPKDGIAPIWKGIILKRVGETAKGQTEIDKGLALAPHLKDYGFNRLDHVVPQPPPLDEWLQGREILTVSQDGKGMFKTIGAALDALKPGQVVKVLDKGPYREFLNRNLVENVSLISEVGTRIELEKWTKLAVPHQDPKKFNYECCVLRCPRNLRISGFDFVGPTIETDSGFAVVLSLIADGDVVLERCRVYFAEKERHILPRVGDAELPRGRIDFLSWSDQPGRLWVRENYLGRHVLVQRPGASVVVERNHIVEPVHEAFHIHAANKPREVVVRENVVRGGIGLNFFGANVSPGYWADTPVAILNNVIEATTFPIWFAAADDAKRGWYPQKVRIQNNVFRSQEHRGVMLTAKGMSEVVGPWRVSHNAYANEPGGVGHMQAFGRGPTDRIDAKPFLSDDPKQSEYLRISSKSPLATAGAGGDLPNYIGPFRPGLAPKAGDWFTRLNGLPSAPPVVSLQAREFNCGPSSVNTAAFSPSGKLLASFSGRAQGDGDIKLWDTASGKLLKSFEVEKRVIFFLAFSADEKTLITDCQSVPGRSELRSGELRIWNLATGESETLDRSAYSMAVAYSPERNLIVSGATRVDNKTKRSSGEIKIWDAKTKTVKKTFQAPGNLAIVFSPDGKLLASGGGNNDPTIKLWDVEKGEVIDTIAPATTQAYWGVFSPKPGVLAISSRFSNPGGKSGAAVIVLWDFHAKKEIKRFAGSSGSLYRLAFSKEGDLLACANGEHLRLIDMAKREEIAQVVTSGGFRSVAFSPDDKFLAAGCGDGVVRVWNLAELRAFKQR